MQSTVATKCVSQLMLEDLEGLRLKFEEKFFNNLEEKESPQLLEVYQQVKQLRDTLINLAYRVTQHMVERCKQKLYKFGRSKRAIQEISGQLQNQWNKISSLKSDPSHKEKSKFFAVLGELEQKINAIQADPAANDRTIEVVYEEEQLFQAITSAVTIGAPEEQFVIGRKALFEMRTGICLSPRYEFEIPDYCGLFQMNKLLYVCGGNQHSRYLNDLFSVDYHGISHVLKSMPKVRGFLSLTGQSSSTLMASGGYNRTILTTVERYELERNKWNPFPHLREGRGQHASCMLKISQTEAKAFVFCGYNGKGKELNSIESLQLKKISDWIRLPVNDTVRKLDNMAAVPYQGNVLVFGGNCDAGHSMYLFGDDAKLKQDLSSLESIPGGMSQSPYVVHNGKVFTIGTLKDDQKPQLKCFDGNKWTRI